MRLYNMTSRFDFTKIKLFVFFILLIFNQDYLLSQTVDEQLLQYDNMLNSNSSVLDLSTPDVKQFQRHNLSSISEYSGKVNLSLPIYTIKAGNISYPISLNYDSGGIKVEQESGNVGLGWSLSNIAIVRKIMDGQDFDDFGKTESEAQSNPNYRTLESRVGYFKYKAQNVTLHSMLGKIDVLPDIFNVYLPSGNSSFYFENPTTTKELTVNEIKISSQSGTQNFVGTLGPNGPTGVWNLATKDFFSFKITDVNGLIYDFNDYDVVSNFSFSQYADMRVNIPYVSSWMVSKITDPSTNKSVEFTYEDAITEKYQVEKTRVNNRRMNYRNFSAWLVPTPPLYSYYYNLVRKESNGVTPSVFYFNDRCCIYSPDAPEPMNETVINDLIYYKMKRLKKITFPEGYLSFEYDFTRQDVEKNNKGLSSIKLFDNNNKLIKEFTFGYSHFDCDSSVGGNSSDFDCKRLKLETFQESGLPSYKFEYIYNLKLPRKTSKSVDFLGYGNGSNPSGLPQLYYYPNKGAWSILPFDIQGEEFFPLVPNYSSSRKSDLQKTQQGILNKITFPSGGSEDFEYELNAFQIFGNTINGGGLRIKKQTINDGKGNQTFVNYQYINDNNQSSGQLARPPMYGYPQARLFNAYYDLVPPDQETPPGELITDYNGIPHWNLKKMYNTFYINDRNNMDADINNGLFIGYSHVNKIHSDGSYEKMKFTSRLDYPDQRGFGFFGYNEDIEGRDGNNIDNFYGTIPVEYFGAFGEFLQTNSNFEGNLYTDFSKNRGKLLYNQKYTAAGQIKKEILYQYQAVNFDDVTFRKPLFSPHLNFPSLDAPNPTPPSRVTGIRHYGEGRIRYQTSRFKPVSIKETEYLPTSSGNTEHVMEQKFTYLNQPPSNRLELVSRSVDAPHPNHPYGTIIQYGFQYADHPNLPYNNSAITTLRANNNLNSVVSVEKTFEMNGGNALIQKKINKYIQDATTANLPLIGSIDIQRANDLSINEASYKYDNKGNVIEYTLNNGTPVSIVWGYKQLYPIAKIEGIAYSGIPTSLITNAFNSSNADNDSGYGAVKENDLRTKLNVFRTNSTLLNANVLITSYTHDPLIGVTSVTNPNGITGYYKYDVQGRLEKVIDQDGKELKGFEYNIPNP